MLYRNHCPPKCKGPHVTIHVASSNAHTTHVVTHTHPILLSPETSAILLSSVLVSRQKAAPFQSISSTCPVLSATGCRVKFRCWWTLLLTRSCTGKSVRGTLILQSRSLLRVCSLALCARTPISLHKYPSASLTIREKGRAKKVAYAHGISWVMRIVFDRIHFFCFACVINRFTVPLWTRLSDVCWTNLSAMSCLFLECRYDWNAHQNATGTLCTGRMIPDRTAHPSIVLPCLSTRTEWPGYDYPPRALSFARTASSVI